MKDNAAESANAPRVLSVPEAGKKYFDMGHAASYAAAKNGNLPTIKMGRNLYVPIVALERMLNECTPTSETIAA